MATYPSPRPTVPVPDTTGVVARDNLITLDQMVSGTGDSVTNRFGRETDSLAGLQKKFNDAIQAAGGVPINGGVWAAGQTFNAYNEYMIYNGVAYKPQSTTPLPYGPTASTPDTNFVQPYGGEGVTPEVAAKGETQSIDLLVYPPDFDKSASITAPYNNAPSGTNALRDSNADKIYFTSQDVSGAITAIDFGAGTATVGGVAVTLVERVGLTSTTLPDYTNLVYKASGGNSAVENMIAEFAANPLRAAVGSILKTGGTTWEYSDATGPITIDNFRAFNVYSIRDFGAVLDAVTDDAQAWIDVFAKFKIQPKEIFLDGNSLVTQPLFYQTQGTSDGLIIRGTGEGASSIIGDFDGDSVISIDGSSLEKGKFQHGGGFKSFKIVPKSGRSISHGISSVGWWTAHHEDIRVGEVGSERFTGDGIYTPLRVDIDANPDAYASVNWVLDRVVVQHCLGYGVNGANNQGYAGWTHNNCRYERNAKSGLGVHCAAHKVKGGSFSVNGEYGIDYSGEPGVTVTGGEFEFTELDGNGLGGAYISRVLSGSFISPRVISRVLNEDGYPVDRSPNHFVFDISQLCSDITITSPYHRTESATTYDVVAYATKDDLANGGNVSGASASGINTLISGSGQFSIFKQSQLLNSARFRNQFSLSDGKNINSSFNSFAHSSSSTQAITNTIEIVKFDLSVKPTGWSDYNVTTGELTAPYEGFYMFDIYMTVQTLSSGDRVRLFIYKNGAVEKQYYWDWQASSEPVRETISINDLISLSEGDVVDIRADSTSGAVTQFDAGVLTIRAI